MSGSVPPVHGSIPSSPSDFATNKVDDKTPLLQYIKKQDKVGRSAGGAVKFQCNFCNQTFSGSYTRVKAHLLKFGGNEVQPCPKVTFEGLTEMKKLMEECEQRLKSKAPMRVPLPSSRSTRDPSSGGFTNYDYSQRENYIEPKKKKGTSGPLAKSWKNEDRQQCDSAVARMFYTSGLPFHLARNPCYRELYTRASRIPGYVPPGYNTLRTTLLQREKSHIEWELTKIKGTWKDMGVSVYSDGWSDPSKRPLINVMATCENGTMFLKAVNCFGEIKDKTFIAEILGQSIAEIGHQNVVQVITDNADACRAVGLLIEAKFSHIFWTPCVVHTLNLALKNICSPQDRNSLIFEACRWIKVLQSDAQVIKVFVHNNNMRLSMYNDHCKMKLLAVADTSFASTVVMLKRLKKVKEGLQQMVISPKWDLYREDDVIRARQVKDKILDDNFWDRLDDAFSITVPIYEMLRMADTDKPCLHLVYEWWDSMIHKVKMAIYRKERKQLHEVSMLYNEVHKVLVARWIKSTTPLHCLAHSLNPKYYSEEWLSEDSSRQAPHKDAEITKERKKTLEKFFFNVEDQRKVNVQYAEFSMSMNDFNAIDVLHDRFYMEPLIWWGIHGASAPMLQTIAFKFLGKPCSSSCCERNWSTYNFTNSLKRNQLTPQIAEDLVFVHNNLRLLARKHPIYNEGVSQMWDVGGDQFDSMDASNVGILEDDVADISLDEPALEAILFSTDEGGDNNDEGGDNNEEHENEDIDLIS